MEYFSNLCISSLEYFFNQTLTKCVKEEYTNIPITLEKYSKLQMLKLGKYSIEEEHI